MTPLPPPRPVDAYEATDSQYLRQDSSATREDGCTAVTAVHVGQRLLVANVGDSRAVLCRGGKGAGGGARRERKGEACTVLGRRGQAALGCGAQNGATITNGIYQGLLNLGRMRWVRLYPRPP